MLSPPLPLPPPLPPCFAPLTAGAGGGSHRADAGRQLGRMSTKAEGFDGNTERAMRVSCAHARSAGG